MIEHLKARLNANRDDPNSAVYVLVALARCEVRLKYEELETWLQYPMLARHVYPLMGMTADPRAVPCILQGVRSQVRGARFVAAIALARLCGELSSQEGSKLTAALAEADVLDALKLMVSEEDETVASAAVELLGAAGVSSLAADILQACAGRAFLRVGVDIVLGFGKSATPSILGAMDRLGPEAVVVALEVLERLGDARAVPACIEYAAQEEGQVAETAVRLLGSLGGEDVVDELIDLVQRGDPGVVAQAALALAVIGGQSRDFVSESVRMAINASGFRPAWLVVLGALQRSEDLGTIKRAMGDREAEVDALPSQPPASIPTVLLWTTSLLL